MKKEMFKRYSSLLKLFCLTLLLSHQSCKKALEVDLPIDRISGSYVYNDLTSATSAVTGLYEAMADNLTYMGASGIPIVTGLLGDELKPLNAQDSWRELYLNNATVIDEVTGDAIWGSSYRQYIYGANALIHGISNSEKIDDESKDILIGESKFVRAFAYFYLVNLYGDVPLVLNTDFQFNSSISRSSQSAVYLQIVADLVDAQKLLRDDYLDFDLKSSTSERVRPNKAAATALLSRVYLYTGKFKEAESEATKLIASPSFELLDDLNKVFQKNSRETIWALQPNPNHNGGTQQNTLDGQQFIPLQADGKYDIPNFVISDLLLNQFENNDHRKSSWIKEIPTENSGNFPIPYKYKIGGNTGEPELQQEYTIVLRLAEQFLIRAEARMRLGNLEGAKDDLFFIRRRAGLDRPTEDSSEALLSLIDHERYLELFSEMGHRWMDMKRRNTLNQRMLEITSQKGGSWEPYMSLFPIPHEEFINNPSLSGHQNPGYPERK